ncbi:unnamed protein product, partial [Mycena citricolor]
MHSSRHLQPRSLPRSTEWDISVSTAVSPATEDTPLHQSFEWLGCASPLNPPDTPRGYFSGSSREPPRLPEHIHARARSSAARSGYLVCTRRALSASCRGGLNISFCEQESTPPAWIHPHAL